MAEKLAPARTDWGYLWREALLLILWAYVVLVAGTLTGTINFRIQFASAVLATVLFGLWLLRMFLRGGGIPRSGLEVGLLIFFGTQILATLFSQDLRRSLPVVALYLAYAFVFYLVLYWRSRGWPAELFEKTFLIVGGIVVGLALYALARSILDWREMVQGLQYAASYQQRLFAVLGDANLLAAFANLLIPLALGRALITKSLAPRLFLSALALGALTVAYYADSRAGMLALAAELALFAGLWVIFVSERARTAAGQIWQALRRRPVLLVMLVLAALTPVVFVAQRALQFEGDATHGRLLSSRSAFWGAAWTAFRGAPLWGTGPGSFPTAMMGFVSMPPWRPYPHAHSAVFNFAAESGLAGLFGVVTLLAFVARRVWQARSRLGFEKRARWAAWGAALGALSVHSLADSFLHSAAIGIPAIVLLALLLSLNWEARPQEESNELEGGIKPLWLAIPGLAALALAWFSLRAYAVHEQGLAAAQAGDWSTAAQRLAEAQSLDSGLALYSFEAGYAYGMLAQEGEREALDSAIQFIEGGLEQEDEYALNYANLSALYRQAGEQDEALSKAQAAVALASAEAIFWLNLGIIQEEQGNNAAAEESYFRSLEIRPALHSAAFWLETQPRSMALTAWRKVPVSLDEFSQLIERGQTALAARDYEGAEKLFAEAWRMNDQSESVYLGLGELARARGELDEAASYFRVALWIQRLSNEGKVWPLLSLAEVEAGRGHSEEALRAYQQVYTAVSEYGIYGWGSQGWNPYAWFVYQRNGLAVDVLPQLRRIDLTPELAERLRPLVAMYEASGEGQLASAVEARLQEALPK